jgi:hypothetical protein
MNSLSLNDRTEKPTDITLTAEAADALEEPWFDEAPTSSRPRPSAPPVVHVGEFLGDPEVDSWLR